MNSPKNSDVLIIGGGIIGLSIARKLRERGIEKITILEKNASCGMEASSAAAGMLAPQAEADSSDSFFRFCQESRDLYPHFAAELLNETGIDIELDRSGTLYLAFSEKDAEELEKRFAWQSASDLAIEKLNAKEILKIEPDVSPDVLLGLRFPLDWQVENRQILKALDLKLKNNPETSTGSGVEFLYAQAKSLIFDKNKIIGAKTARGNVFAAFVIIASGAWTSLVKDEFNLLSSIKIKPVRGQIIEFKKESRLFRHVIYMPRGYAVPRRDNRILVGATVEDAGFDCAITETGTALLLDTAYEISSEFKKLNVKNNWAGLRPCAPDGLPVLGEFPGIENFFIATGHFRNGILLAPKTAEILADKIIGESESEYLEIFSPRRFAAAKAF